MQLVLSPERKLILGEKDECIVCIIKLPEPSTSPSLFKALLPPSSALVASSLYDFIYLMPRSTARCQLKAHSSINLRLYSNQDAVYDVWKTQCCCNVLLRERLVALTTRWCNHSVVLSVSSGCTGRWSRAPSSPVSTVTPETWSLLVAKPLINTKSLKVNGKMLHKISLAASTTSFLPISACLNHMNLLCFWFMQILFISCLYCKAQHSTVMCCRDCENSITWI